ncbi:MAG: aminotransferase class IV family protein [Candidatus Marinimicrobia bacterium]|nr:aminotransferase class IV family protein [FCB group bacterium]MBL7026710.1 aminotransferase class IV family protein [Candidatus Neomarinimicrobiota bacterium]
MLIYASGLWVEAEQAVVPFNDQGFLYGDSLFETVRVNHGKPFRLEKHLERMQSGMDTIQMESAEQLAKIPEILKEYISRNNLDSALARIIVTRGISKGSPWRSESTPTIYMTSRPVNKPEDWPVRVIFLEEKNYPILRFHPAIKSGNYLGNMLAKKDAEDAGAFEPVFVNRDGYVTECAIRNIFFIKDDVLLTPCLELGVLPGVIRDTIMELAQMRHLKVREALINQDDVPEMDEAFISSTGVGVLPVTWDGFKSDYHYSQILREDLDKLFESGESNVT